MIRHVSSPISVSISNQLFGYIVRIQQSLILRVAHISQYLMHEGAPWMVSTWIDWLVRPDTWGPGVWWWSILSHTVKWWLGLSNVFKWTTKSWTLKPQIPSYLTIAWFWSSKLVGLVWGFGVTFLKFGKSYHGYIWHLEIGCLHNLHKLTQNQRWILFFYF